MESASFIPASFSQVSSNELKGMEVTKRGGKYINHNELQSIEAVNQSCRQKQVYTEAGVLLSFQIP